MICPNLLGENMAEKFESLAKLFEYAAKKCSARAGKNEYIPQGVLYQKAADQLWKVCLRLEHGSTVSQAVIYGEPIIFVQELLEENGYTPDIHDYFKHPDNYVVYADIYPLTNILWYSILSRPTIHEDEEEFLTSGVFSNKWPELRGRE
jgi:hypothetical protein